MKLKAERDAFKTVKQEAVAAHKEKLAVRPPFALLWVPARFVSIPGWNLCKLRQLPLFPKGVTMKIDA